MKAVGVICEFNPFHKGHAYLLEQIRASFPEKGIVCVMSGNFVQRGDFAIQEKYSRARCAVAAGADLVLELPFPFSCLSAEAFADSAVSILSRIGICDTLAFGSEIDDEKALSLCADRLGSGVFRNTLSQYLVENKGVGFPAAREAVYEALFGEAPALSLPNASLGVEYLRAIRSLGAALSILPVKRLGEGIKSEKTEVEFASATAIRSAIFQGKSYDSLVPEHTFREIEREREAGRFPADIERLWQVLSYCLKIRSRKELSEYYGFASLCDRARRFAPSCSSMEELVQKMKNASYTDSRIRRGLLALICQIPRHAEREKPQYSLILSANERGREMLSEMKEKSELPIFTKPAHALRARERALLLQANRAFLADEIYSMAFPKKQEEGFFLKQSPRIL